MSHVHHAHKYIGFFITTISVEGIQYWVYISIALAAVHHYPHVTDF